MRSVPYALNGQSTQVNATYDPATDGLLVVVALTYNYTWTPPPPPPVVSNPLPTGLGFMSPLDWWLRLIPYLPPGLYGSGGTPILNPTGGIVQEPAPVIGLITQVDNLSWIVYIAVFAALIVSAAAAATYGPRSKQRENDGRNDIEEE